MGLGELGFSCGEVDGGLCGVEDKDVDLLAEFGGESD